MAREIAHAVNVSDRSQGAVRASTLKRTSPVKLVSSPTREVRTVE